jgi:hypothetical protein
MLLPAKRGCHSGSLSGIETPVLARFTASELPGSALLRRRVSSEYSLKKKRNHGTILCRVQWPEWQHLAISADHHAAAWTTDATTTYESVKDLARALRHAAPARGQDKTQIGQADKNWPELVRLVHDRRAGRSGSANMNSPTDSWEDWNHAL